jgi:uncharacterized protein (DUF2252 family)
MKIHKSYYFISCLVLLMPPLALADRATTVIDEISSWNAWLDDDNRQAKYCKMVASPYIFYRGTNHLFWKDFAADSRLANFGNDKTKTWLQGDLHAYNFGSYDNDDGEVIYELNDFDEAMVADYQYDVWRMAVSLVLIARENNTLSASEQEDMIDAFSESYLDTMADYRGNDQEQDMYFTEANTYGKLDDFLDDVEDDESRVKMLDKWTDEINNVRRFDLSYEKLGDASSDEKAAIIGAMSAYGTTLQGGLNYDSAYFQVKDVARRLLAGTGSLGTPRYYVLIEGASDSQNDDRILDVKRQSKPTAYRFLGQAVQTEYDALFSNDAERHALGYLALTNHTDDHLGWMTLTDGDYSVRERSPYKESFPAETLDTTTRFNKLAEQWGLVLATAHARADKDFSDTYVAYSVDKQIDEETDGEHAAFRALVREIAFDYADQVQLDWQVFYDWLVSTQIYCP